MRTTLCILFLFCTQLYAGDLIIIRQWYQNKNSTENIQAFKKETGTEILTSTHQVEQNGNRNDQKFSMYPAMWQAPDNKNDEKILSRAIRKWNGKFHTTYNTVLPAAKKIVRPYHFEENKQFCQIVRDKKLYNKIPTRNER